MTEGSLKFVVLVVVLATGTFLWFLTNAYRSNYEVALEANVRKGQILSQVTSRRVLSEVVQEKLEKATSSPVSGI